MNTDKRFDFFGTHINAVNLDAVVDFLTHYNYSQPGYVCFPDSSVVATAHNDASLQAILNNSLLTVPDGKPSEIFARKKGFKNVSTVSGFWLCKRLLDSNLTHYFLGSTEPTLKLIAAKIKDEFPDARVLGYHSPPFRALDYFKAGNLLEQEMVAINELAPDLIWIGLSSPKQDYFMRTHAGALRHGIMLGVGGVFDYLSGDVKKSPEWVKKIGLRWLWRLLKEPKRLGGKYWLTIKVFSRLLISDAFRKRTS